MKIAFQEQEDSRDISFVGSAEEVGKIAILICLLSGKVGGGGLFKLLRPGPLS